MTNHAFPNRLVVKMIITHLLRQRTQIQSIIAKAHDDHAKSNNLSEANQFSTWYTKDIPCNYRSITSTVNENKQQHKKQPPMKINFTTTFQKRISLYRTCRLQLNFHHSFTKIIFEGKYITQNPLVLYAKATQIDQVSWIL